VSFFNKTGATPEKAFKTQKVEAREKTHMTPEYVDSSLTNV
jgi:hypothetical protein